MPTVVTSKLTSWGSDVDQGTINQAVKASKLPIVAGHVALMPDAHVGIGATVGSHGAGRRHSRSAAKRLFTAQDLAEQMGDRTWLADRAEALLDEIPSAYKDIDQVMADQADLVEVTHTLRQILNYKGV